LVAEFGPSPDGTLHGYYGLGWLLPTRQMPLPASCSGSPGKAGRSPRVRRCRFARAPPDLPTCVSRWLSGVPVRCRVTPPRRPYIWFLFVGSGLGLRLPPHPASRRRSCLRLVVPITKAHRGLAPPVTTPCLAHNERAGAKAGPP